MRSEYKRSDFLRLERGKFYAEAAKGATVVVLSPSNAKAFPSSQAVNDALTGVLEQAALPLTPDALARIRRGASA